MWLISGWVTECDDLDNYRNNFETDLSYLYLDDFANPGYAYLNILFKELGLSFEQFHILFYGFVSFVICYFIFTFSKKPFVILFIYVITAFFADIIQMKNSIAVSFLYIGFFFLLENNSWRSKFFYSVFLIIASSLHIAFIFYFIFLFADKHFSGYRIVFLSILLTFFAHSLLGFTGGLISDSGFLTNRTDSYLESHSFYSVIICTLLYLLHLYICKTIFLSDNDDNECRLLYNINILLSFFLVFTSISMVFSRLLRNMLMFNSIFIVNRYPKLILSKRMLVYMYFVIMSLFYFWMTNIYNNVDIILKSNALFK